VFGLLALIGAIYSLWGCTPEPIERADTKPGHFTWDNTKLFASQEPFDLRLTVDYVQPRRDGLSDPAVFGISDRELTMRRCTWCHECGFQKAWDWEHYGSTAWKPVYTGEQWQPVVARMMNKDNSFLQEEQIVQRIYRYLRDDSLGNYKEADVEGPEPQPASGNGTTAAAPSGPPVQSESPPAEPPAGDTGAPPA
jgi:hypothetical protein